MIFIHPFTLSQPNHLHTHIHTCTLSPHPTPLVYCVHDLRNHSHTCNMYTVQYSTYTRSDLMPEMYLSALQIVCAPDSVKIHALLWCGLFIHHHKRFHLGVCLETFPTIRDTITLWTLNVVFSLASQDHLKVLSCWSESAKLDTMRCLQFTGWQSFLTSCTVNLEYCCLSMPSSVCTTIQWSNA